MTDTHTHHVSMSIPNLTQCHSGHPRIVAGSVGPYGACQADGSEYTGSYIPSMTQSDLVTWHRPRLETLAGAGIRVVALETLPALSEALALLELLREFPDLKAWVTFSCKVGGVGSFVCMLVVVIVIVVVVALVVIMFIL